MWAATPADQTSALDALYAATNGSGWIVTWDITTEEPCSRFGVTCDDEDNVIELSLTEDNLSGTIPPEIGDLEFLVSLDLSDNFLSGPIPEEIGNLAQLTTLNLAFNNLEGPIGPWIGQLEQLELLSLGWNGLQGELPSAQLAGLKKLAFFGVSSNPGLTGNLDFVAELPSMQYLYCDACGFTGPLPNVWDNVALQHLVLSENSFTGEIPPQIGNLRSLLFLSLADNKLSGTLPDTMRTLTNVTVLRLDHNELNSTIDVISNMTSLEVVFLQDNSFQASDLAAIIALPAIKSLQIQDNCFWQLIPETLCTKDPRISFQGINNPWMCPLPSCLSTETFSCSNSTKAPICAGGTRVELSSSDGKSMSSDEISLDLRSSSELNSSDSTPRSLPRRIVMLCVALFAAFLFFAL